MKFELIEHTNGKCDIFFNNSRIGVANTLGEGLNAIKITINAINTNLGVLDYEKDVEVHRYIRD